VHKSVFILPGFVNENTDRPLTFEQSAADVAALVKHLQIEQDHLFGESFDGFLAVMITVRHARINLGKEGMAAIRHCSNNPDFKRYR